MRYDERVRRAAIVGLFGLLSAPCHAESTTLYIAAALFNGRETRFNADLARRLEQDGYKTILPQRDGFEFGELIATLSNRLPGKPIGAMAKSIIYYLDMGKFIPAGDAVVANLDEPIDEGVVVEITYAKLIGKPVVCFRTDIRSPYGDDRDSLGGMHTFVAYQCTDFVRRMMPSRSVDDGEAEMAGVVDKIKERVQMERGQNAIFPNVRSNPQVVKILQAAGLLFGGIADIHSKEGLEAVVGRFAANRDKLEKLEPKVSRD